MEQWWDGETPVHFRSFYYPFFFIIMMTIAIMIWKHKQKKDEFSRLAMVGLDWIG